MIALGQGYAVTLQFISFIEVLFAEIAIDRSTQFDMQTDVCVLDLHISQCAVREQDSVFHIQRLQDLHIITSEWLAHKKTQGVQIRG